LGVILITEPLFASIKSRLIIFALIAVLAAIAALGIRLYFTNLELSDAAQKIDQLRGQKANLQSDLDSVTAELQGSEKEVERLHKEVQLTAALLTDREAARKRIESIKSSDRAQISRVIENANTETKAFADADMPDDFASMLKRASYCANNNNQADTLCIAAGGAGLPLPDP
jgi:chromosome segregation ATPase